MTLLPPVELDGLWEAERPYLNTASFGLPPRTAYAALQRALEDWRHGHDELGALDRAGRGRARAAFARIVGCHARGRRGRRDGVGARRSRRRVAARRRARRRPGRRVHVEPLSVARAGGARRHGDAVPLERLADSIDQATTLVAFSVGAVVERRGRGRRGDRGGGARARRTRVRRRDAGVRLGARVGGVRRLPRLPRLQVAARPARDGLPHGAAGAAQTDGARSTPAGGRRRTRTATSTACRSGSRPTRGGSTRRPRGSRGSARHRRSSCSSASGSRGSARTTSTSRTASARASNSEPSNSAIVTVDVPGSAEKLARAGIAAAVRADRLRVSFHLYNTAADVDAALDALRG